MSNLDKEFTRVFTQNEIESIWKGVVPKVTFLMTDVPDYLRSLIPYAQFWGLMDDSERRDNLRGTPELLKRNLKWVVQHFDDQMDHWLAGPEATSENPSDAYIAFSAMRMAADTL